MGYDNQDRNEPNGIMSAPVRLDALVAWITFRCGARSP